MKLLIVEDEKLSREILADIPWHSIDVELIGQADGANSALKIVNETPPDIVITDISMEDGDGFYLAEKLSYLVPTCKIIFLTAFDTFEYAHKAINYKPFAFILKPINCKEIISTVEKAKEEIVKINNEKKHYQNLLNNFSDCKYFLGEYFFSLAKKHPEQLEQFFQLGNEKSKYQVVLIKLDNNSADKTDFKIFWNIETLLKQSEYQNNISFYDGNKLTFIFYYDNIEDEESFDYIYNATTIIENHIQYAFPEQKYTISIGSVANSKEEIHYSMQRALDALKYKFSMGENQILYIDDLEPLDNNIPNLNETKGAILDCIKVGNTNRINILISRLFDALQTNNISSDLAQRICFELVISYSVAMGQLGYNPETIFKQTNIWDVLNQCHSLNELKDMISDITYIACSMVADSRENKGKDIVELAINIVKNNVNKDISLQEMADRIHISSCYLSSMFKKKTGMSYKHFIVEAKINKAKELLIHSDTPIYKIATNIGYKSPQHFSTVFKEHTGLLPTEYRNNHQVANI